MNDMLTAAVSALTSPEGIVLVGYTLTVFVRMYISGRDMSDFDIELFGTDIDIDIGTDHGIPLVREFTITEQTLILLSLYYQYAVVAPQTGLQSLLTNVSSLILFGIFMDYIVNRYLVNREE